MAMGLFGSAGMGTTQAVTVPGSGTLNSSG